MEHDVGYGLPSDQAMELPVMNYWIFKVSQSSIYADVLGEQYVFDNTHSVRVAKQDEFIYLEKSGAKYALTGAGRVSSVQNRPAAVSEQHNPKVNRVFTATLSDVIWFDPEFDISPQRVAGRRNRLKVGLPRDLNEFGWSISMPRIAGELFASLLAAALDDQATVAPEAIASELWRVEDSWALVKRRSRVQLFRSAVLVRHNFTCLVCGTRLKCVLDAAHLRSYASDIELRANPANGICLCRYCHGCFDAGRLVVRADGSLVTDIQDPVALQMFAASRLTSEENACAESTNTSWKSGLRFLAW